MRRRTITILCLLFGLMYLHGQTLIEEIGGVRTNFTIVSDTLLLDTDEQFLIKRAVHEINIEQFDDGTMHKSDGYEAFHLEFIVPQKVITKRKVGRNREYFVLSFLTDGDQLLTEVELKDSDIKITDNWEGTTFSAYSINLQQIPLVILDRTLKVNLVHYKVSRYW